MACTIDGVVTASDGSAFVGASVYVEQADATLGPFFTDATGNFCVAGDVRVPLTVEVRMGRTAPSESALVSTTPARVALVVPIGTPAELDSRVASIDREIQRDLAHPTPPIPRPTCPPEDAFVHIRWSEASDMLRVHGAGELLICFDEREHIGSWHRVQARIHLPPRTLLDVEYALFGHWPRPFWSLDMGGVFPASAWDHLSAFLLQPQLMTRPALVYGGDLCFDGSEQDVMDVSIGGHAYTVLSGCPDGGAVPMYLEGVIDHLEEAPDPSVYCRASKDGSVP